MANEGVSFLLELDAKLDGALGMVRALRDSDAALKRVDAGLRKVEQASGHAGAGHRKHGQEADKLGGAFGRLGSSIRGVVSFEVIRRAVSGAIDLVGNLASGLVHLGVEALNVAAANERTGLSFELLFGAAEGKATLEWLEGIAKFTEFTDDELKGMAGSLAKVGFAGEDLTRALAASLDMAAFSGSGEAGANQAISSLERIKRTGNVENRSLQGLGIGKDDFLKELSARTGLGTAVLKKKLDEGKIAAETSLEALYAMIGRKTGKDLGGAGVAMGNTLQARLKHLKDLPDQFFQKLRGTDGFAKISEFTGRLVDALDPESATGQKIMGGLTSAFDTIGDLLGEIDIEALVTKVSTGMTDIAAGIRPALAAFRAIWDVIESLAKAMAKLFDLFERFTPLGIALGKLADKLSGNQAEKAGLNKSILGERMGGVDPAAARAELKRRGGPLPAMAGPPAPPMFGPPAPLDPGWVDKGQSIGKSLEVGTRDALGLHSPSKVFENIGLMTGAGFNKGIDKSLGATDDVSRGALAIPAPGGAGQRGGSPIHVEIHTTVNASGNGERIAQDVSTHIREILPGALQSAIEQLAGQAGSA